MDTYDELNKYLNELFIYLSDKYDIFVDNLSRLTVINDELRNFLNLYDLSFEKKENNLTDEDVYLLAREIIESINPKYLDDFDNLIKNGELDFGYNEEYDGSYFKHINDDINIINIKREYSYEEVISLIHEYIHYINLKNISTKNSHLLTEFLAIYFEIYAMDYLIDKGINKDDIYYKRRLLFIKGKTNRFYNIESPLLVYKFFGEINDENYKLLYDNIMQIPKENYDRECSKILIYLKQQEKKYNNENFTNDRNIESLQEKLGYDLAYDLRYILGTIFTFYTRKYSKIEDIVWLNNHINDSNLELNDILNKLGINIYENDFTDKMKDSIKDYLEKYDVKKR